MEPLEEAVPERLAQAEIDTAVSVARRVAENIQTRRRRSARRCSSTSP